jgi:uncharacterized membrane protein
MNLVLLILIMYKTSLVSMVSSIMNMLIFFLLLQHVVAKYSMNVLVFFHLARTCRGYYYHEMLVFFPFAITCRE